MGTRPAAWLASVAIALLAGGCAFSGEPQQPGFTELITVESGDSLTQTFTPRGEPLTRVDVLVATFAKERVDGVVHLTVEGAGETREVFAGRDEIRDAAWLELAFPPIEEAAGETFTATFAYEGNDPVAFFVNPNDPYPDGSLQGREGDLAFRVGHFGRISGLADAAGRVVSEFGARLGSDIAFTAVWLLVLVGGGALAAWLGRGARDRGEPAA